MKKYVLAYYDSEDGMEILFTNTMDEAYDIMKENLDIWYEDLSDFPTFEDLADSVNQDGIGDWRAESSVITYFYNRKRIVGYISDRDTETHFEIVRVKE